MEQRLLMCAVVVLRVLRVRVPPACACACAVCVCCGALAELLAAPCELLGLLLDRVDGDRLVRDEHRRRMRSRAGRLRSIR